ncbi:winged helix-turn-helix domain-containing protein [Vibrio ostreicida]|uniref:Winged helix-turn-helix domain-containing protein n=1 Tax=Vibrio ostreicida TaxID=526588 RepID=A0ABT8C211_9VIBR|nr:winged helix-turn-helix domain-containing protein [Vibrio ostreicida]MDN3612651.1 winged helix-turn-helix domain-containing protein [Vibrio ostreicida]
MKKLAISNLVLDLSARKLSNSQHNCVTLRPLSFEVLLLLIKNQGEPVKREVIYEQCWPQRIVTDQALTNVISELRRHLVTLKAQGISIKTISKVGYYIELDDRVPIASLPTETKTNGFESPTNNTLPVLPKFDFTGMVNERLTPLVLQCMVAVLACVCAGLFVFKPFEQRPDFADPSQYQRADFRGSFILSQRKSTQVLTRKHQKNHQCLPIAKLSNYGLFAYPQLPLRTEYACR